jgi:Fic family protein
MEPPFSITSKALKLSMEVATILGNLEAVQSRAPQAKLRKANRIKTIQGSLSIEGNTLTIPQITAILDNKRVIGPQRDIIEAVNAIKAYEGITTYKSNNVNSMLKAHKCLLDGLIEEAGSLRRGGVGILKGKEVSHIAPPASRVPLLMDDLFSFLKTEKETHSLIKSCVFHYELMFIHPFSDGNGRIGRLWQTVILIEYHPIFEFLPIESLIKEKQKQYYDVLEECDSNGNSTAFIEFMLELLLISLQEFKSEVVIENQTGDSRLKLAQNEFKDGYFSRKNYMLLHKTISSATASRDLKLGIETSLLESFGEKARTKYQFS